MPKPQNKTLPPLPKNLSPPLFQAGQINLVSRRTKTLTLIFTPIIAYIVAMSIIISQHKPKLPPTWDNYVTVFIESLYDFPSIFVKGKEDLHDQRSCIYITLFAVLFGGNFVRPVKNKYVKRVYVQRFAGMCLIILGILTFSTFLSELTKTSIALTPLTVPLSFAVFAVLSIAYKVNNFKTYENAGVELAEDVVRIKEVLKAKGVKGF